MSIYGHDRKISLSLSTTTFLSATERCMFSYHSFNYNIWNDMSIYGQKRFIAAISLFGKILTCGLRHCVGQLQVYNFILSQIFARSNSF